MDVAAAVSSCSHGALQMGDIFMSTEDHRSAAEPDSSNSESCSTMATDFENANGAMLPDSELVATGVPLELVSSVLNLISAHPPKPQLQLPLLKALAQFLGAPDGTDSPGLASKSSAPCATVPNAYLLQEVVPCLAAAIAAACFECTNHGESGLSSLSSNSGGHVVSSESPEVQAEHATALTNLLAFTIRGGLPDYGSGKVEGVDTVGHAKACVRYHVAQLLASPQFEACLPSSAGSTRPNVGATLPVWHFRPPLLHLWLTLCLDVVPIQSTAAETSCALPLLRLGPRVAIEADTKSERKADSGGLGAPTPEVKTWKLFLFRPWSWNIRAEPSLMSRSLRLLGNNDGEVKASVEVVDGHSWLNITDPEFTRKHGLPAKAYIKVESNGDSWAPVPGSTVPAPEVKTWKLSFRKVSGWNMRAEPSLASRSLGILRNSGEAVKASVEVVDGHSWLNVSDPEFTRKHGLPSKAYIKVGVDGEGWTPVPGSTVTPTDCSDLKSRSLTVAAGNGMALDSEAGARRALERWLEAATMEFEASSAASSGKLMSSVNGSSQTEGLEEMKIDSVNIAVSSGSSTKDQAFVDTPQGGGFGRSDYWQSSGSRPHWIQVGTFARFTSIEIVLT